VIDDSEAGQRDRADSAPRTAIVGDKKVILEGLI